MDYLQNEENDIYKEELIGSTVSSIIFTFVLYISLLLPFIYFTVYIIQQGINNPSQFRWWFICILSILDDIYISLGIVVPVCSSFYRRVIIKKGTKHVAKVIDIREGWDHIQHGKGTGITVKTYILVIQYGDKRYEMKGVYWNPTYVLENWYCTIYEYKGHIVPTNFKVNDEFITSISRLDMAKAVKVTREKEPE